MRIPRLSQYMRVIRFHKCLDKSKPANYSSAIKNLLLPLSKFGEKKTNLHRTIFAKKQQFRIKCYESKSEREISFFMHFFTFLLITKEAYTFAPKQENCFLLTTYPTNLKDYKYTGERYCNNAAFFSVKKLAR